MLRITRTFVEASIGRSKRESSAAASIRTFRRLPRVFVDRLQERHAVAGERLRHLLCKFFFHGLHRILYLRVCACSWRLEAVLRLPVYRHAPLLSHRPLHQFVVSNRTARDCAVTIYLFIISGPTHGTSEGLL